MELSGIGMTSARTRMRLVSRLRDQGIANEGLLEIIGSTPRHIFVDEALSHRAYEDTALPIGFNQTLTQPIVCARMLAVLLDSGPLQRILEVGTGSGYQTSILAQICERVYTIERIKGLQDRARERLKLLGLRNVHFRHADGGLGWPDRGPYDGIIVSASPRAVPLELLSQLVPQGRMIVPVGDDDEQELQLITLNEAGYTTSVFGQVRFVPLLPGTVS